MSAPVDTETHIAGLDEFSAEYTPVPATEPGEPRRRFGLRGRDPGAPRPNVALWTVTLIAVIALVAGLVVGRFVISPADAAADAEPPTPGLITVPVALSQLNNDVTIRGNLGFTDATPVTLEVGGATGIVTGQVPEVGSDLDVLSVALEVAGRPVIVLPGELPAFRSLSYGMSGPDVIQFREAMAAIGINAGVVTNNVFDATAARAVRELFERVGYPAPDPSPGAIAALEAAEHGVTMAQQAVQSAERAVTDAQNALTAAQAGPPQSVVIAANNEVDRARRELEYALANDPEDTRKIARLEGEYRVAIALRDEQLAPADTTMQREALDAARANLTSARRDVTAAIAARETARNEALPSLPAGEILFLTELPRRVDAVHVSRGSTLSGPAFTVSGASLELIGTASEADARHLEVGMEALFDHPDGSVMGATIIQLEPEAGGNRVRVHFEPEPFDTSEPWWQGANVRIRIPVGATAGDVLNVPAAALTAGAGGEARVEVVTGDPADGDRAATHLVTVTTGLAAGGFVEITPIDGELHPGDLVVVGR